MSFVPQNTQLGRLRAVDVLDWYDGPRLFVAENEVQTRYLCFWIEESDDSDGWLYVPISEHRLNAVLGGMVSLRDALGRPELPLVYVVRTSRVAPYDAVAKHIASADIEAEWLPPDNDFLREEAFVDIAAPLTGDAVRHQVKVWRKGWQGLASFEGLVSSVQRWVDLVTTFVQGPLIPSNPAIASFSVQLESSDPGGLVALFQWLASGVAGKAPAPQTRLSLQQIDSATQLVRMLRKHSLTLEARILVGDAEQPRIVLGRAAAEALGEFLERHKLTSFDSSEIPQADDLERVHRLVSLLAKGQEQLGYELEITPRQVNYYRQAARILGYVDSDGSITLNGVNLSRQKTEDARLRLTAAAFESSRVGLAWLKWSGASTLRELQGGQAEAFLTYAAKQVSLDTIARRAATLRAWVSRLQGHHYLSPPVDTPKTGRHKG